MITMSSVFFWRRMSTKMAPMKRCWMSRMKRRFLRMQSFLAFL